VFKSYCYGTGSGWHFGGVVVLQSANEQMWLVFFMPLIKLNSEHGPNKTNEGF